MCVCVGGGGGVGLGRCGVVGLDRLLDCAL